MSLSSEPDSASVEEAGGIGIKKSAWGNAGVAASTTSIGMLSKSLMKMGATNRGSVSEADLPMHWDSIANDLDLNIDSEYATGAGELLVEFPTGIRVRMGAKMKMADCRSAPSKIKCSSLASSGNQDDLYILMFLNPDVPSMDKPLQRSWLHWMLVNVKGFNLDTGRVLCKYQPPTPSANSGMHRYIFLLLKQEEHLDQVAAYEDARRGKFNVSDFIKRYNLSNPLAMTFFHAERPGSLYKKK